MYIKKTLKMISTTWIFILFSGQVVAGNVYQDVGFVYDDSGFLFGYPVRYQKVNSLEENSALADVCRKAVEDVELNATRLQEWLYRHTVQMSGRRYNNTYDVKILPYKEGQKIVEWSRLIAQDFRDEIYARIRTGNVSSEYCDQMGDMKSAIIYEKWEEITDNGRIP